MNAGEVTRSDVCIVACAEAFRGDGEIFASPMGTVPMLGARLARATFEPDLVLTDGIASIVANNLPLGAPDSQKIIEGWMPFRTVFDALWWGKRHVMMGASQIDIHGNQNISCVGPWERPKAQLLGVRGAPGNTINHVTSYFVGAHSKNVFVPAVDMVSGVGYDRIKKLKKSSRRFHQIRRVITNLGVFDFGGKGKTMRVVSLHPGVTLDQVQANTGFALALPKNIKTTRLPTAKELTIIRQLDPSGLAAKEVAA